jgi:hypothetical protein
MIGAIRFKSPPPVPGKTGTTGQGSIRLVPLAVGHRLAKCFKRHGLCKTHLHRARNGEYVQLTDATEDLAVLLAETNRELIPN